MEQFEGNIDAHERQLHKVEQRLETLIEGGEEVDEHRRQCGAKNYGALEQNIETCGASPTPSSSAPSGSASPSMPTQHIAVLVGIGPHMPEAEAWGVVNAFLQHVGARPPVPPESPYRATAVIHLKSTNAVGARAFVQSVRDLPSRVQEGRVFWATVRHPKERRARNRKVLKATEVLQKHSKFAQVKEKTASDMVCWRSPTIVLVSRRIVTVREPDSIYIWADGWYSADLYSEKQDVVVKGIEAIACLGRLSRWIASGLWVWSWNGRMKSRGQLIDRISRQFNWSLSCLQEAAIDRVCQHGRLRPERRCNLHWRRDAIKSDTLPLATRVYHGERFMLVDFGLATAESCATWDGAFTTRGSSSIY